MKTHSLQFHGTAETGFISIRYPQNNLYETTTDTNVQYQFISSESKWEIIHHIELKIIYLFYLG